MDEPRPATTEFHRRLRTVLYNLGEEYGVTGFEAAGVLSYLAAEVNAGNLAADGLLSRGPGLQEQESAEPEPATATDQPVPAAAYIAELEAKCQELEQERGASIDERDELYGKLEKAEVKVAKLESTLAENQANYRALQKRVELDERVAFLAKENSRLANELHAARSGLPVVPPKRFPWPPSPFRI